MFFRFHREDVLAKLLSQLEGGSGTSSGIKCVPSYVAPGICLHLLMLFVYIPNICLHFFADLASAIRRHVSQALRQRKGSVPCYYISELATYTLPPGKILVMKF